MRRNRSGERAYFNTCAASQNYKFTGDERDAESGLDYTPNRMYNSQYGRWLSPDPAGTKAVTLTDPQTWNMYAYVRNNPTTLTDPSGLYTWGNCTGGADKCQAEQQRFRDSITNANKALKGLDPKSKEAKALQKTLNKLGEEGKGDIKINFGDAGTTRGEANLGKTVGHNITINYDAVDSAAKARNLNPTEALALDTGLTTHEGTHAFGPGPFGILQGHFEHPAYYTESVTYQGLHNTDRVYRLWDERWLEDPGSIETQRERGIQIAIHPDDQPEDQ